MLEACQLNWQEIKTPIQVDQLERFLCNTGYDEEKSNYLIDGFTNGFDIGYRGPKNHNDQAPNLPFKVVKE